MTLNPDRPCHYCQRPAPLGVCEECAEARYHDHLERQTAHHCGEAPDEPTCERCGRPCHPSETECCDTCLEAQLEAQAEAACFGDFRS